MTEADESLPHVIEPAASGRSRCRGCGTSIGKGTWRFGERLPNPYGDGAMTLWLHLPCAAYRRPEPFLPTMQASRAPIADVQRLVAIAQFALEYPRISRIAGLERAPSARARCRACRKLIEQDALRIPLVFYQEGAFERSGFVHVRCAADYFGTGRLLDCVRVFATAADDPELLAAAAEVLS